MQSRHRQVRFSSLPLPLSKTTDRCADTSRNAKHGRRGIVRKALVFIAIGAALVLPAAAAAGVGVGAGGTAVAPIGPAVVCGTACDGGGGGWSGCTEQTASESGGIPWLAYYKHYLVV